ncbi:MAG: hypothetical protein NVSMB64_28130 [Candidatus Velthaea sp.]
MAASARAALAPTFSGTYSDGQGSFAYTGYVPSTYRPATPLPLVLALHGCLENPANFEAGARWFEDAQAFGYIVLMPQHVATPLTNPNGCYQYWNNHYRGSGEPELLVDLVRHIEGQYHIDPNRVFVAGLSSGGAMAMALMADYPDVFAAGAVGSGTEYQPCATDNVYQCYLALTNQAFDQNPTASGKAAYGQLPSYSHAVPLAFFQGDADTVVAPFNLPQALKSSATMNDGFLSGGQFPGHFTAVPSVHRSGAVAGGHPFDVYYADGGLLMWTIVHGMNHAWSGGVKDAASNASDGNNYNDPLGPNETAAFRYFLMSHPRR